MKGLALNKFKIQRRVFNLKCGPYVQYCPRIWWLIPLQNVLIKQFIIILFMAVDNSMFSDILVTNLKSLPLTKPEEI